MPTQSKGRRQLLILLVPFCIIIALFLRSWIHLQHLSILPRVATPTTHIPRKIWQIRSEPVGDIADDKLRGFSNSWTDNNPKYRYELLTDDSGRQFVNDSFADEPSIVNTFSRIDDRNARADFLRFLVILKEGGLYAGIGTECTQSVDSWVPEILVNTTGCVIGVEYDALNGLPTDRSAQDLSLHQWTFMARPDHPVLRHVVDSITAKLQEILDDPGPDPDIRELSVPMVYTRAVLGTLVNLTSASATAADVTGLEHPKRFGDVLIMPTSAFGCVWIEQLNMAWVRDDHGQAMAKLRDVTRLLVGESPQSLRTMPSAWNQQTDAQ